MSRKNLYLLLCVIGVAIPYSQFVPWLMHNGPDGRLFVAQLLANRISTFFVADVLVSAAVLVVFMGQESKRLNIRHRGLAIAGLCLVGVSFALPLFLYLRERAQESVNPSV
jgi:heme/copper-type cytochrome/quinol oxidase subunit 4